MAPFKNLSSSPATKLASGTVTSPSNPSHRPLDIDKLYYTRGILSVQWSVDGEHLYFDTNITGRYNIWAVPSNRGWPRSEEHTSELQSQSNLVCRLLLEKKKKTTYM